MGRTILLYNFLDVQWIYLRNICINKYGLDQWSSTFLILRPSELWTCDIRVMWQEERKPDLDLYDLISVKL